MKKKNQLLLTCLLLVSFMFQTNIFAQNNGQHSGRYYQNEQRTDNRISDQCQWRQLGQENNVFQQPLGMSFANNSSTRKILTTNSGIEIWGGIIYANSWNQIQQEGKDIPFQMAAFNSNEPKSIKTIKQDPYLNINGGAAIYDGKLHFINILAGMGYMIPRYCEMDIETWQHTANSRPSEYLQDITLCATSTVTDPETGVVYGQFFAADGKGYEIGTIDYDNLKRTTITYTEINLVASAMNSKGEWFGVGKDGMLYQIDKGTGDMTQMFSLGVEPCYTQGAIFDPDNDNLIYWAASFRDDMSALYTIDLSKKQADFVSLFPDNEEIAFMYIPEKPSDNAPAMAENVSVKFVKESLQGEVSFTVPGVTYGGETLTGSVDWEIFADKESLAKGSAAVGETVKQNITVAGGNTFIKIVLSNKSGKGATAIANIWVGYDETELVKNLIAEKQNNKICISWDAPVKGLHGGYVDAANLKYNIMRCPDSVMVAKNISATTFTDVLGEVPYALYYYAVTSVNGNIESKQTISEKISYGSAYDIPFANAIQNEDEFAVFTIVDNNNDGISWMYREEEDGAFYPYTNKGCGDDWLITPPIKMKNDRQYKLSYDVRAHQYGYKEAMNVYIMQGENVNENCSLIAEYPSIENDFFNTHTNTLEVAADGEYRIAYRAMSPEYMYGLHVQNINIIEGSKLAAPDSVTNIKIVAAELGKLSSTVEFIAPALNCGKKQLNSITKIVVKNVTANKVVATLENVNPGEKLTVADKAPENGFNDYEFIVFNTEGEGVSAAARAYIGMDMPDVVNNIKIYDNNDGSARLTWDVPSSIGVNGGYVDVNDLNYTVSRYVFGEGTMFYAEGIAERECLVCDIPMEGIQECYNYSIYANSNALGELNNTSMTTPYVISGDAYEMPFFESFRNGNTDNSLWFISCKGAEWVKYSDKLTYDGALGCAYWYADKAGDEANLNSGKIAICGDNPKLVFKYYGKKSDLKLNVNVRVDGQTDNILETIDFNTLGNEYAWYQCVVPVKQFKDNTYVEVRFNAVANMAGADFAVDNIELMNILDHNLNCVMSMPKQFAAGGNVPVQVKVRNLGENEASDYAVKLYADGKMVDEKAAVNLASLKTVEYSFEIPTKVSRCEDMKVYAEVEYYKDMNLADNKVEEGIVKFVRPNYPKIEDLMATENSDGSVLLNWNAPTSTIQTETDDFESYDPFTKGEFIGPWKTLDLDGAWTFTWDNIEFPGSMREMSYIVFNPYLAENMELEDRHATLVPRNNTGAQYLICWDATYASPTGNNDWVISPELPACEGMNISFYARSFNEDYGMEDFEVLYSVTGSEPEDFSVLETNLGAPATDWTLFEFELPAEAKFFAIRCYSKYKVAFMVDDITYPLANLTRKGYNVYRDGKFIGNVDENTTSFIDSAVENNMHSYQVTVVYTIGESDYSNIAVLSSIDNVGTDDVFIRSENRCIRIFNAEGKNVKVYTADGMLVCSGKGTSDMNIYVKNGNYIISIDNIVAKVAVK